MNIIRVCHGATGNPNGKGLPEWSAYREEEGATMFFDNGCVVQYGYEKELMQFATLT